MTAHHSTVYAPHYKPEPGQHDWSWAFVVYREIPEFPGYVAGTDGSIWSRRRSPIVLPEFRWKLLKPWPNRDGHLAYGIYSDGKFCHRFGHQLVLTAFSGPCPDGMEGCHGNGNPADNRLDNLRWDTRKANAEDCIRHGRRPRGADHGRAKLRAEDVLEIRRLVHQGETRASVSRRYGISNGHVTKIMDGRLWGHVG